MAITCLFPYIKEYSNKVNITHFSGKIAAVDASCWIHKALALSVSQTGNRERFFRIFNSYLQLLKDSGVTPIVVFDGQPLQAKAKESTRRQSETHEQISKANENQNINNIERNKLLSRSVEITYEDVVECVKLCLCQDVKYIISPYESDAQLAFFVKNGYADFVVTEDSDLLVYGCKEVVVKLKSNGYGEYFKLEDILSGLHVTMAQFVEGCVAAGCDYLKNVRGVGINKAFTFVKAGNLFDELGKKGAPSNYETLFKNAVAVFMHQTVFDPTKLHVRPLQEWITEPGKELQNYCGVILKKDFANELAAGNVNMKNGEKQNNFHLLKMIPVPEKQTDDHISVSLNDQNAVIDLVITAISKSWFPWTISGFPLITLEFVKLTVNINGKEMDALVKRGETVALGNVRCTKHCNITIENISFIVLWEFALGYLVDQAATSSEPLDSPIDNNDTGDMQTQHTLPFKVLGTCHSKERQNVLERAYEYLYEYNRPVYVSLEQEPDNPHDNNAIAVFIQTDAEFKKVGYIASELTKHVQPLLKDAHFDAEVKSIRFRTTYMMIGFYITIELSKKGLWHDDIVKASRCVM